MYKIWIFLCCLFLCTSCYRSDPWRNLTIKAGNPSFNSSKLIYPATHFLHDLELEFLYTSGHLHAYINVYAQLIPPYEGNEKLSLLTIETQGHSHRFIVDRLAGGQRLKIPEDTLGPLVQLFKDHPSVVMQLGAVYKTKINTKEFKQHFDTLHVKPLALIPNNPIGLAL